MVENTLPAVEPLAVSDKCTLVLEKLADGKIRVTSTSLVEDKVILAGQVLEVRSFDGRLPHCAQGTIARRRRPAAHPEQLRPLWAGRD